MNPKVAALSERERPKNKNTHPVWVHLNREKANRSIMTERTSVVAWASEGVGGTDYKGQEGNVWG